VLGYYTIYMASSPDMFLEDLEESEVKELSPDKVPPFWPCPVSLYLLFFFLSLSNSNFPLGSLFAGVSDGNDCRH
jgi:hypothetical protein